MDIKVNGNTLTIEGQSIKLTRKDVLTFECLNAAYPMAVSNDELGKAIKTYGYSGIKQRANILRKKLEAFDCIKIDNVHSFGWVLVKVNSQAKGK